VPSVAVWVILVAVCGHWIWNFQTSAGECGDTPSSWPVGSSLSPVGDRNTLVMFVHPKCPCTRESLSELNIIMNADAGRAAALIAFLKPDGVDAGWERTASWDAAGAIPNADRFVDRNGSEASRFGVRTSGHVLVYDPGGHLRFSGGITDSRGHAGDNMGRRMVRDALADDGSGGRFDHPVYGCPLSDDSNDTTPAETELP
jgi:hypothetical protein